MSIEPLIAPFVSAIITACVTGVGIYVAMSSRLSVLETKMDDMREDVQKHNRVVERTYKLESETATQWHRIDEMKEELASFKEAIK